MEIPILFRVVSLLLSAAIASAAWLIARRQAIASEEKLRLDLYDKRFQVYSRAFDFLQALMLWSNSNEDRQTLRLFVKAKSESQFLFPDSEIPELLDRMYHDAFKVIGLKGDGKELAACDPKFHKESMGALPAFASGVGELQSKMEPYLNFHQIRR